MRRVLRQRFATISVQRISEQGRSGNGWTASRAFEARHLFSTLIRQLNAPVRTAIGVQGKARRQQPRGLEGNEAVNCRIKVQARTTMRPHREQPRWVPSDCS